jgi:hypothetical protein
MSRSRELPIHLLVHDFLLLALNLERTAEEAKVAKMSKPKARPAKQVAHAQHTRNLLGSTEGVAPERS